MWKTQRWIMRMIEGKSESFSRLKNKPRWMKNIALLYENFKTSSILICFSRRTNKKESNFKAEISKRKSKIYFRYTCSCFSSSCSHTTWIPNGKFINYARENCALYLSPAIWRVSNGSKVKMSLLFSIFRHETSQGIWLFVFLSLVFFCYLTN